MFLQCSIGFQCCLCRWVVDKGKYWMLWLHKVVWFGVCLFRLIRNVRSGLCKSATWSRRQWRRSTLKRSAARSPAKCASPTTARWSKATKCAGTKTKSRSRTSLRRSAISSRRRTASQRPSWSQGESGPHTHTFCITFGRLSTIVQSAATTIYNNWRRIFSSPSKNVRMVTSHLFFFWLSRG